MKEKLVSIIVPVYNTAKYLSKCIESLINQTYQNIEVVLINDGSTDNSLQIINKYEKSEKILIISQKNKGANLARANGLKHCHGDYVMFVDSDDYILPNTVEELMNIVCKENTDIIKFKYINFEIGDFDNYCDKESYLKELLISNKMNNITNEIISRKIIDLNNSIFKIKSSNAEDLMMNLSFFDKAKKVIFVNKQYYYYTLNENSTTKNLKIDRVLMSIKESDNLLDILFEYAEKWHLNSEDIIYKIKFGNIYAICSKVIRLFDVKLNKNIIDLLNNTLDNVRMIKWDYKKIISYSEKHYINKRIYLNIIERKYSRARFLWKTKKIIKKFF